MDESQIKKVAIRFGLGAIKSVGMGMMEKAQEEREKNGEFKDIFDFATRIDPKFINKKSIEALAKSGSFDSLEINRKKIHDSFDILSSYASNKQEELLSNQMSLFGVDEINKKPELRKTNDWNKSERLQKEFEAFGFFLNDHPLEENISSLKKRGIIFSNRIEEKDIEDGSLVKMCGIVASSKHRSSNKGRFAYLTISDPFGMYEVMIFDEALITSSRDILIDGSQIFIECLIRKDEGGTRLLIRNVKKISDFINSVKELENDFEDIKKTNSRSTKNSRYNQNQEEKIDKKISQKNIEIKMIDVRSLSLIKEFLTNKETREINTEFTRIVFSISDKKVELPQKFLLGQSDINWIKSLPGVISAN